MAAWDRRTPWRQGRILDADTVASLRLVPDADPARCVVVVVSHDCDLAQSPDCESVAEVIVGRLVDGPDGNFTHGKNPRRLHISATEGSSVIWIELTATARRPVPKSDLCGHTPSATLRIDSRALDTLQSWLAARYRRSAFPDDFDRHLEDTGMARRLARILVPLGTHVVAVFFDVDEGMELEHEDDDPFTLSIDLLYSTDFDSDAAEDAAQKAAEAIKAAFCDRCFDPKARRWRGIELLECSAISDEALTYAMSRKLKRWNADHISLRADPAQPMLVE